MTSGVSSPLSLRTGLAASASNCSAVTPDPFRPAWESSCSVRQPETRLITVPLPTNPRNRRRSRFMSVPPASLHYPPPCRPHFQADCENLVTHAKRDRQCVLVSRRGAVASVVVLAGVAGLAGSAPRRQLALHGLDDLGFPHRDVVLLHRVGDQIVQLKRLARVGTEELVAVIDQ